MSSREKLKSILNDFKDEIEFRRICRQNPNMSRQKIWKTIKTRRRLIQIWDKLKDPNLTDLERQKLKYEYNRIKRDERNKRSGGLHKPTKKKMKIVPVLNVREK